MLHSSPQLLVLAWHYHMVVLSCGETGGGSEMMVSLRMIDHMPPNLAKSQSRGLNDPKIATITYIGTLTWHELNQCILAIPDIGSKINYSVHTSEEDRSASLHKVGTHPPYGE
jgi:hypothetical protein